MLESTNSSRLGWSSETQELEDFIARGALAVERLIEKGLEAAQQEFNN